MICLIVLLLFWLFVFFKVGIIELLFLIVLNKICKFFGIDDGFCKKLLYRFNIRFKFVLKFIGVFEIFFFLLVILYFL